MAALLAALLPVDRLIAPDAEAGVLDQLAVRGIAEEAVAAAKLAAHWLSFGPPLMLAALPGGGAAQARRRRPCCGWRRGWRSARRASPRWR